MIKIIAMDVDGTLTDGKIYMGNNKEIMKAFNVKDGLGIKKAIKNNIISAIITGRTSKIVEHRASELTITEVFQGVNDKLKVLDELAQKYKVSKKEIAFIGDDINDMEAMQNCGFVACPNNAINEVKDISNFISKYNGGDGAVREIIDHILTNNL